MAKEVDPYNDADYIVKEASKDGVKAQHYWRPGRTLGEMTEIYGEDTVYEWAVGTGSRFLQNAIRSLLAAGKKPEEVTEILGPNYRPDVSRRPTRLSDAERIERAIEKMDEGEVAALLAKMKQKVAELKK